ncbi:alpha/beta hydrolase [Taibaiella sp. KBW10]|uniref:alpha/beta fold hydrolase n=1 Tax=Taibaiella sp. KBW10 TaxID=2153357 RepID=UPI000F5A8547|nr:alpha/beta hydrolase [Taibaiella sp. KBW10]RQO30229.1 alpha/beta hydrolase [Taibaiella sp. KBW10]
MKKAVYFISGLGSDERVFQHLDLNAYEVHHIKWIKPFYKESMAAYARRLAQQINDVKPVIVGLSMGGMMAVEIGKFLETEKIILISSAKYASELPRQYNFFAKLKLHRYLPDFLLNRPNKILYRLFGVDKQRDKVLLRSIIQDTDPKFVRWAIDAILEWDNEEVRGKVIHIHGTEDRIIPIKNIAADYIISKGSHSLVFQKPEEISALLLKIMDT